MSWEAVHFMCNYLKKQKGLEKSCEHTVTDLKARYPEQTQGLSPSDDILEYIFNSSNAHEQQELIDIYAKLDFSSSAGKTERNTGLRIYLALLLILYVFFSALFFAFILPSFQSLFSTLNTEPAALTVNATPTRWMVLSLLVALCVGIMLRFNRLVQNSTFLRPKVALRRVDKIIFSNKLLMAKMKLLAIMFAPLKLNSNDFSESEHSFVQRLREDDLDVATQLQYKYIRQLDAYTKLVNKRQKQFNVVLGLLIMLACYHLLYSIYSPLFNLGVVI